MHLSSLATLRTSLPGTRVSRVIGVALVIHVLTAWFNGGFLHPDEHFQIIEFAWYRLGHQAASALPWEFASRIRAAFQPWLAAGLITTLQRAGIFTPFLTAFLLRLASSLLGLWVSLRLCAYVLPSIRRLAYRELAFYGTLFLWISPFLQARFSAESWGASLTFLGLTLLVSADAAATEDGRARRATLPPEAVWLAACAGLVSGVAFFCRVQMAPAIAGAVVWWLVFRRESWRLLAVAVAGFVVASVANVAIDHWLYGVWVFTPFRYVDANIIQGKASGFGTSPWWMAFAPLLLLALPPFNALAFVPLLLGVWTCRRHVLAWMIVPFVIAHAATPHKELRFMAPMLLVIALALALSLDRLPSRLAAWLDAPRLAVLRTLSRWAVVVSNTVALTFVTFMPALSTFPLVQQIWEQGRLRPVRLLVIPEAPSAHQLPEWQRMAFYTSETVSRAVVLDGPALVRAVGVPAGTSVLVLGPGPTPPPSLTSAGIRCVLRGASLARTVDRFDVFGWVADKPVWTLWEVER
jgi:phosphatidylinositol glycan class B